MFQLQHPPNIPPKVLVANSFVMLSANVRVAEGALSAHEDATYTAALEVLRTYFTGEMSYGEQSCHRPHFDDPDK